LQYGATALAQNIGDDHAEIACACA
jgi:hypothetical protein